MVISLPDTISDRHSKSRCRQIKHAAPATAVSRSLQAGTISDQPQSMAGHFVLLARCTDGEGGSGAGGV